MSSFEKNSNNETPDGLDNLLKSLMPPEPEFNKDTERMLKGFHKKMETERTSRVKRRKKNFVRAVAASVFIIAFTGFFNIGELGSDGFKMVHSESENFPDGIALNEFRGGGYNLLEGDSIEDLESLNRVVTAESGIPMEAFGFEIRGRVDWRITREYSYAKGSRMVTLPSENPFSDGGNVLFEFVIGPWPKFEEAIINGTLPSAGIVEKILDAEKYRLQYWVIETEDFGQVKYFKGKPIPGYGNANVN